jgi:hypothetical protein
VLGGLEATACLDIIVELATKYEELNFVVAGLVSDDDSTMRALLQHSYSKKIIEGTLLPEHWPQTPGGNDKVDRGQLPLGIPEPTFYADCNHRTKVYAGACTDRCFWWWGSEVDLGIQYFVSMLYILRRRIRSCLLWISYPVVQMSRYSNVLQGNRL